MLILTIAAALFSFPGGTTADLANALAKESGQAVVVTYGGPKKLRGAEASWTRIDKLKDRITALFLFDLTKDNALGFGPTAFDASLLDTSIATPICKGIQLEITDGKATAAPEPDLLAVAGSFSRSGWSKPVKIPWFLGLVPVALAAKDAPEEQVLTALADALGAKLVTGTSYDIQPIPKVFKAHLIAGYDALASNSTVRSDAAWYSLTSAYLGSLKVEDVVDACAAPNTVKTIEVNPGTDLYRAAWQLGIASAKENPRLASGAGRLVDGQQAITLTFRPRSGVSATYRGRNGAVVLTLPEPARRPRRTR